MIGQVQVSGSGVDHIHPSAVQARNADGGFHAEPQGLVQLHLAAERQGQISLQADDRLGAPAILDFAAQLGVGRLQPRGPLDHQLLQFYIRPAPDLFHLFALGNIPDDRQDAVPASQGGQG